MQHLQKYILNRKCSLLCSVHKKRNHLKNVYFERLIKIKKTKSIYLHFSLCVLKAVILNVLQRIYTKYISRLHRGL